MILYTIQNVISLNCLFNYIFFYKTVFFAFPKIRNAMLDFLNKYFLVSIVELVNFILRKSIANSIA